MKILKLTGTDIGPATAIVYKNKKTEVSYFNIKHGSNGENLWTYRFGLSKTYFSPESEDEILALTEDNYVIKPIKKDKLELKDGKGNIKYAVTKDHMENHRKDVVLFWEIPNKNYTDVTYEISGKCIELGKGISGKERENISYISPAPVLEIIGDVVLVWRAVDAEDRKIEQTIKYTYNTGEWEIGVIAYSNPAQVTE